MLAAMRRFVASSSAPWALLAVTIVLHVLVTLAGSDPFAMVDLKVYLEGAQHLTDGTLYDFFSEPLHLPFTYPTFSAIIFTPMTWLPWTVLRVLWQAASFGAIGLIAYATLRLLGRAGPKAPQPLERVRRDRRHHHRVGPVAGTGAHHLQLRPDQPVPVRAAAGRGGGQQGMVGRRVGRAGLARGLTPAITGLYYLLQRRWSAVAWSVVFFAGTVLLGLALVPSETVRFFTALMFDPGWTGPVWSAINQSLRGAVAGSPART